jgi:cytochrome c-type biogenesis protein CcmH
VFLFLSALACLLALAFALVPLFRTSPEARAVQRRLDALDELKGDLPAAEWQRRHDALEAERDAAGGPSRHGVTAVLIVVLVPVLVVLFYRIAGTPEAMGPTDPQSAEIRQALGELAATVNDDPENVEAWTRMGMIWKSLQQWPAAESAWRRVLFLDETSAFARVELAETLLFASGRPEMPDESMLLLTEAVLLDPDNQKALWLSGMGAFQQGRFADAVADWQRLDTLLPPGNVKDQVNQQIERARFAMSNEAHAGVVMQGEGAAPAQPSNEPAAPQTATEGPSLTVTVDLAPELAGAVTGDETVFVFARASAGPPLPLAVQRFAASELPRTVTLTDADAMAPNMALSNFDTWDVVARISASGNATASPGDLQGVRESVTLEDGDVAVRINERVE